MHWTTLTAGVRRPIETQISELLPAFWTVAWVCSVCSIKNIPVNLLKGSLSWDSSQNAATTPVLGCTYGGAGGKLGSTTLGSLSLFCLSLPEYWRGAGAEAWHLTSSG